MPCGVTKSCRPIRMIVKVPLPASARSVFGVIVLRKNISQASLSVSGVSSVTSIVTPASA